MNKNTCVIYAPVTTFSGYGARGRDIAKAIIELKKDEWDIKILPCRWGNTSQNFINENPKWKFLEEYFTPQLTQQPDIMVWVTVPNEFQPIGKYNIGVTAGIETNLAPSEWVEGCQRMDLILGSSKHTIEVLRNSKFEKRDKNTNQLLGSIYWDRDSEVLFEGADTETYFPDSSQCLIDFDIKEKFAYLFVGHWLPGQMGEDRKNVGLLVKAFLETFKNKTNAPALILKTSTVSTSYIDRDEIVKRIKAIKSTVKANKLPNIYLLHGDFTDEEMNSIYNHSKVKAMINLTKGEGFGRPLLEFSLTNKPIISTNYSGHTDFLDSEFTTLLPGSMTKVHPSAANQMLLQQSEWFSVDMGSVGHYLNEVFENYKKYIDKGKRQGYKSRTNFSFEKMKEKLDDIFKNRIPEFPKQVQLQLPKLNKLDLPKLQLPKLKKIEQ
jgi:glycosyltransferase involved in cell wall biosynthesis